MGLQKTIPKIAPKPYAGMVWMKHNWQINGWDDESRHYGASWPAICAHIDGQISRTNLDSLISWTHPRNELGARMSLPPDMDNDGGWGAVQKVNEIHQYLLGIQTDQEPRASIAF